MSQQLYSRKTNLLEAQVGDELVGLEPVGGTCFGFNDVATSVWQSLERPKSFDQLRSELMDQYEVDDEQCTRELQELLADMVAKDLIVLRKQQGTVRPEGAL